MCSTGSVSLSKLGFRVGRRRNNPSASEDPETTPKPSSTEQAIQPQPSTCSSLAPVSNRASNPSTCFEPGLCSNLPSDHPPLTIVASWMHVTTRMRASLLTNVPRACHASIFSCRRLQAVFQSSQDPLLPAASLAPRHATQPPLMGNARLQQSTVI